VTGRSSAPLRRAARRASSDGPRRRGAVPNVWFFHASSRPRSHNRHPASDLSTRALHESLSGRADRGQHVLTQREALPSPTRSAHAPAAQLWLTPSSASGTRPCGPVRGPRAIGRTRVGHPGAPDRGPSRRTPGARPERPVARRTARPTATCLPSSANQTLGPTWSEVLQQANRPTASSKAELPSPSPPREG